jgi:hypothetical protein
MFHNKRILTSYGRSFFEENHTNFTVFYHSDKHQRITEKHWHVSLSDFERSAKCCYPSCSHPACLWFAEQKTRPTYEEFVSMDFMNDLATPAIGSYIWTGRRGNLNIAQRFLPGKPNSHGIPAYLCTDDENGIKTDRLLNGQIIQEINFLQHVLEFNKSQDLLRRKGEGKIEMFFDIKTTKWEVKPVSQQKEDAKEAAGVVNLEAQDEKNMAQAKTLLAESRGEEMKAWESLLEEGRAEEEAEQEVDFGVAVEDIVNDGDNIEMLMDGCKHCKLGECLWLVEKEGTKAAALAVLPGNGLDTTTLPRQRPFASYRHLARIQAEIIAANGGERLKLPECVVVGIHSCFPLPKGRYQTAL